MKRKVMNTREIITFTADIFKEEFLDLHLDYINWLKVFRFWEAKLEIPEISVYLPLREPVVKLIYKQLYNSMPFDKEYVLKHYEKNYNGIEYLIYPCKKPQNIIVFFSGYSTRKTYNRYSWFWDKDEKWQSHSLYVFVRDPQNSWYSEAEYVRQLTALFHSISTEFSVGFNQFVFVGGSMGGYGALRFGLQLQVNQIIAIHPQLTLEPTKYHQDNTWFSTIESLGDSFIPITNLVTGSLPKIFIEFGEYKADKLAAQQLIDAYDAKEGMLVVSKHSRKAHVTEQPDFNRLHEIMNFFNKIG